MCGYGAFSTVMSIAQRRDTSYGNDCFALEGILRMEMSVSHWKGFFEWKIEK